MKESTPSIFQKYYEKAPFIDRYADDPDQAVDVIVPVIHTNELWRANLLSFYREIPIHKLLIGDGGCIDNSMEIAREFPRTHILDHRSYKSLGYSVRKLIEAVETDWFIYVHSDVYLPPGWFDVMQKHQTEYDWFGCLMQHTVMIEYNLDYAKRPWAGSQMGRKEAFITGLHRIEDDFVYRQEDFVFADIVNKAGFKEGKISDTFHYHQTIYKKSAWMRKIKSVQLDVELSQEEEVRTCLMQAKGIVKYLDPDRDLALSVVINVDRLQEMGKLSWADFNKWVKATNSSWLPFLNFQKHARSKGRRFIHSIVKKAKTLLK
jgi:hypothetical protein